MESKCKRQFENFMFRLRNDQSRGLDNCRNRKYGNLLFACVCLIEFGTVKLRQRAGAALLTRPTEQSQSTGLFRRGYCCF